jgi:putative peptidoglycan lipid II flippase
MQDSRTPALVNIAAIAVNIVLDLFFFFVLDLGIQGLALGFALEYTIGVPVLVALMRRRLIRLDGRRILGTIGKTAMAGSLTAATAWLVARALAESIGTATIADQAVQVLGSVAAGVLVFGAAATVLRIEEVAMVRDQVVARWRR